MGWLDIALKVAQLLWALAGLWRSGGSDVVKKALADSHKSVCDERCKLELRQGAEGEF